MENKIEPQKEKRAHIFEIDLLRAITIFSVVVLHSLSYTSILITDKSGLQLISLIGHTLHYSREMFMFITGLVLTYVYYHHSFSMVRFWRKRALLILVPYILWSLIYVFVNNHNLTPATYFHLAFWNILTGKASFQLYYILLALEFYIIFPFFLMFMKKVASRPLLILLCSLIFQLVFMNLDYRYVQTGLFHLPGVWQKLIIYQDRNILTYQFFFIFGAFAAVYLDRVRAFYQTYGRYVPMLFVASLILFIVFSYWQIMTSHASLGYTTSVLQSSVVLYSIVAIIFALYLAIHWVSKRRAFRLIQTISDTSFGLFLVHILILTYVMEYLFPVISGLFPIPLTMVTILLTTFALSVLLCYLLLKTPFLSWTIGRTRK